MTPVPFANTAVRFTLAPAVMAVGLATKLVMEATGVGVPPPDEPEQPERPSKPRLSAEAHEA
jgi:hypothetical protein